MWKLLFTIFIVFGAVGEWKVVYCSRLYDINMEAIKLYGEDLNTVLKRFRRTPEYLAILNEKVTGLKERMYDIYTQAYDAHELKVLPKYINETLDHEHGDRLARHTDQTELRSALNLRTQEASDNNTTTTTLTPVEKLERAVEKNLKHELFTITERNALKELGFKIAGMAIQSMIEGMGPAEDESEKKSTKMEGPLVTTTEHVAKHDTTKVTNLPD